MSTSNTPQRPAELLATLGAEKLADIIVSMVSPAGALGDRWDSGTIETVLSPLQQPFLDLGIEWIGNTGADETALRYWLIEERKRQDPSWELISETVDFSSSDPIVRDIAAIDLICRLATGIESDQNRVIELRQKFLDSDMSTAEASDAARDEWEQLADNDYGLWARIDEDDSNIYSVSNLSLED